MKQALAVDFRNLSRTDPETIKEWFDKINEAGKKIVEAVNLPPLSEDKIKPINQNSKS